VLQLYIAFEFCQIALRTAMKFETLKIEVNGSIGRLTLNRPERLNALSRTMLRELAEAAHWFNAQSEVGAVIVSGAGRAFCAGADLKDTPGKDSSKGSASTWLEQRTAAQTGLRMMDAVEQMRATTIASVQGFAVGGGVLLMAACDLRIAAEDARFSIPEVELGIPLTWGGIPRLVREIGPAMTKELVLTCRQFSPQEAQVMGFVNRVVPPDQLEQQTLELAESIAAMPAVPAAITKEHVNAVCRAMAGLTAYADGDVLLSALISPEAIQARKTYIERQLKGKKKK
jgi:enoyl-CoA hydratase/3-hydroxypropionyl-coenzyme A dehydratase